MRKLIRVLTAMFFLAAVAFPLAAAPPLGGPAATSGLKKGLVKPHPKKHIKKAHPVNKGLEESAEKGANGPENAAPQSAGHAGAATLKGVMGVEKGGVPSDGKAGGTTIRK